MMTSDPSPQKYRLSSPSRLHLGMFSLGSPTGLRYGGLGLMVKQPRTVMEASFCKGKELQVVGELRELIFASLSSWFQWNQLTIQQEIGIWYDSVTDLPIRIAVLETPLRHQGLGSGTQLAMTAALAMTLQLGLPTPTVQELAKSVQRAKRSAIGSYGFFQGGLLVDRGKTDENSIAPLDFRCDFPVNWPVVLFVQPDCMGVAGDKELNAFAQIDNGLSAGDELIRQANEELVRDHILAGVMAQDYAQFGEAVYEFGRNSGRLFAGVQGGIYNSQGSGDLIHFIRQGGIPAVGQSSWGPGVFAILPDPDRADSLAQQVQLKFGNRWRSIVTVADNFGCRIEMDC